jgi:hypothetical protein
VPFVLKNKIIYKWYNINAYEYVLEIET